MANGTETNEANLKQIKNKASAFDKLAEELIQDKVSGLTNSQKQLQIIGASIKKLRDNKVSYRLIRKAIIDTFGITMSVETISAYCKNHLDEVNVEKKVDDTELNDTQKKKVESIKNKDTNKEDTL